MLNAYISFPCLHYSFANTLCCTEVMYQITFGDVTFLQHKTVCLIYVFSIASPTLQWTQEIYIQETAFQCSYFNGKL